MGVTHHGGNVTSKSSKKPSLLKELSSFATLLIKIGSITLKKTSDFVLRRTHKAQKLDEADEAIKVSHGNLKPTVAQLKQAPAVPRLEGGEAESFEEEEDRSDLLAELPEMAEIRKLEEHELEDIAIAEGLNHLVGLSKEELLEQLLEYYSLKNADKDLSREKLDHMTKQDLYRRAQELNISGRSQMSKEELIHAIETAS